MFCTGAVGKGQAGVCTQKQRQVEVLGREHKSTVFNFFWDEINTLCSKLIDNPSWYFPGSIWIYMTYVSCEYHWALIYYLLTVWVLNQEVDFNLDLNWGFRSNLTRRFFIPFSPYQSGCKCSLAVIIFARYIFWNKGGFGWSIGKMAYLVTGSHWHKS